MQHSHKVNEHILKHTAKLSINWGPGRGGNEAVDNHVIRKFHHLAKYKLWLVPGPSKVDQVIISFHKYLVGEATVQAPEGERDLSFLLPVMAVLLQLEDEIESEPPFLGFTGNCVVSEDSLLAVISSDFLQEPGLVMQSQVLEDSSPPSPAIGTCHAPFTAS